VAERGADRLGVQVVEVEQEVRRVDGVNERFAYRRWNVVEVEGDDEFDEPKQVPRSEAR
jgi:hypothetical protein